MPALANDVINSSEERIGKLNSSSIANEEDAIRKLQEIKNLGGDLKRDRLFKEIERKFTGRLDIYSIDGVTKVLEERIKGRESNKPESAVETKTKKEDPLVKTSSEDGRKVIDINEYKKQREEEQKSEEQKSKSEVDKKIEDLSEKIKNDLKGDENLKEKTKEEIRRMVLDEETKTSKEKVNDLADTMSKSLGKEKDTEMEVKAKEIKETIDKWQTENTEEIREYRKNDFKEKVVEETRKLNPDISEEQLNLVKQQSDIIADVYFGSVGIDHQKEAAIDFNQAYFSPGTLQNSWSKVEGITSLLKRSKSEVKDIKDKYNSLKGGLEGIKLPYSIHRFGSFDGIVSMLNNQAMGDLFSRTQNYLRWVDRIDKWTGGWVNKTVINWGQQFISRIGNQAVSEFAQNALNVMAKEGLQKGFSSLMNGIISGGVKAGATAAGSAAAGTAAAGGTAAAAGATGAAAAGLSATGVGAIVVAAIAALKIAMKVFGKIADKLGIRLGIKDFLKDTFGKFLGGLINFVVKAGMIVVGIPALLGMISFSSMIGPLVVGTTGGLMGYELVQDNLVSSMVPPTEDADDFEYDNDDLPGYEEGPIVMPVITVGNFSRQDFVNVAMALNKKVQYFWGGKWYHFGPKPNWGKLRLVTSGNNRTTGTYRPDGLDCSGYVTWVYYQLTGRAIASGSWNMKGRADSGEWREIDENNVLPGDIAWRPGHVGLYIGRQDGHRLFIHGYSSGKPIQITSDSMRFEGRGIQKFDRYFRPNVKFNDD